MRLALNIELSNGKVVKQTKIPDDCENVQEYLENKHKHRVLTFDIVKRGINATTSEMSKTDLESFKKDVKKALELADDFGYSEDVKRAIKACKSQIQLDNVLAGARHSY